MREFRARSNARMMGLLDFIREKPSSEICSNPVAVRSTPTSPAKFRRPLSPSISAPVMPSAKKARLCNVRKYRKSVSDRPNRSVALSRASWAAFLVKAK